MSGEGWGLGAAEGFHAKGRAKDEAATQGPGYRRGESKGPTVPTEVRSPSPASPRMCNEGLRACLGVFLCICMFH